jgi:hypothetical protein
MKTIRIIVILFLATILFWGMFACSPRSTPPGPDMAAGVYIDVAYEFFHWEEGLNVMIWHDAVSSSSCNSSSSTDDPINTVDCSAASSAGDQFDWEIKTDDGIMGDFRINGDPYDLSAGAIFIVSIVDGVTDIQQLQGDLTNVMPDHDSIVAYGLNDEDIERFIQSVSPQAFETVTPKPEVITTTPTPYIDIEYPPDTRTGIPEIDGVIDTIMQQDIDARVELVRYIQYPCTTGDGLGGPPKCQDDEADGTTVTAFPVLYSEGVHVRPDQILDVLNFSVRGLLAVYTVPESTWRSDDWPVGETAIVFTSEDGGYPHVITLHISDGEIVRLEFNAGWPPFPWIWDRSDDFILPPSTRPNPNP